jgi:hypothetical protein
MPDPNIWIPSDDLLHAYPIADANVMNPRAAETLSAGVALPADDLDDDALEAAAASVLAELDDEADAAASEEDAGLQQDDEAVDDPEDGTPGDDV